MIKILVSILFVILISTLSFAQVHYDARVFKHDSVFEPNRWFYNHTPQIEVLDSGAILPNGDTLMTNVLICTAIGGFSEGEVDQNVWVSRSVNEGLSWTIPASFGTANDTAGNFLIWNASLFKLENNLLVQFYMFQRNRGAGANGNEPIFLKSKYSVDAGQNWIGGEFVQVKGLEDTAVFRMFGPYTKPIVLKDDSLFFPLYYRIAGNATARFATLKCAKNLTGFSLNRFPNIAYAHPERLIEPTAIFREDSLFVYFRTSRGLIDYIYSINNGNSWSSIFNSNIKNPNTLFSSLENNYLLANLNNLFRDDLSIIELDKLNNSNKFLLLDYTKFPYDQVTYPNTAKSKKGDLFSVYSGIGYDLKYGNKFGDIFFAKINLNSDFSVCGESLIKASNSQDLLNLSKINNERNIADKFFYKSNYIIEFGEVGLFYQKHLISAINTIYTLDYINSDTLILFTDKGVGVFNLRVKSFDIFKATVLSGKSKFLKKDLLLNANGSSISLYDANINLIRSLVTPSVSIYFPTWNNYVDAVYNNDDLSIYILTNIGKIYMLEYPFSGSLSEITDCSIFASSININKDKLIITSRRGDIFSFSLKEYILDSLYINKTFSNQLSSTKIFNEKHLVVGTSQLIIFDGISGNLKNESFCPNVDIKGIAKYTDDSIYLLTNTGNIILIENPFPGLSNFNEELVKQQISIEVLPNPSHDRIFKVNSEKRLLNYKIFNATGLEVLTGFCNSEKGGNSFEINCNQLSPGIYFLQLIDNQSNQYTEKIINLD
jgi:hypothetical protein